jgi:hypothetical protein
LLQIVCFHLAAAAAIFGGTISDELHHRLRWMMLGLSFLIAALYLRVAGTSRSSRFLLYSWFSTAFYPAVTLPDVANANRSASLGALRFRLKARRLRVSSFWQNLLLSWRFGPGGGRKPMAAAAAESELFLSRHCAPLTALRSGGSIVEQGRRVATAKECTAQSLACRLPLFHGIGAILWKNLVTVKRCRRKCCGGVFHVYLHGFFTALLVDLLQPAKKAEGATITSEELHDGHCSFLGVLAFFLQRMFPFDFRRDGHHLLNFVLCPPRR